MKKTLLVSLCATLLCAAPALAVPSWGGSGETPLQGVLDGITVGPVPGDSSVNVLTDYLADPLDEYWHITATGGSVSTIVIEIAGLANYNSFGVYDRSDASNYVEIFAGGASAGAQATLSIAASGDVFVNHFLVGNFGSTTFGYYLDSTVWANNGGFWYSDTSLNADGTDHMAAYRGTGDTVEIAPWSAGTWTSDEYILAWEDLDRQSDYWDGDYQDFVVMVESVQPVIPAPGAILLGSIGVSLVGFLRRRHAL